MTGSSGNHLITNHQLDWATDSSTLWQAAPNPDYTHSSPVSYAHACICFLPRILPINVACEPGIGCCMKSCAICQCFHIKDLWNAGDSRSASRVLELHSNQVGCGVRMWTMHVATWFVDQTYAAAVFNAGACCLDRVSESMRNHTLGIWCIMRRMPCNLYTVRWPFADTAAQQC
jgi:hypothetical protein